jgi:hypothetical protein
VTHSRSKAGFATGSSVMGTRDTPLPPHHPSMHGGPCKKNNHRPRVFLSWSVEGDVVVYDNHPPACIPLGNKKGIV